ncbi:exported hypothetical protein [Pseudomonas sp. IT-P12]
MASSLCCLAWAACSCCCASCNCFCNSAICLRRAFTESDSSLLALLPPAVGAPPAATLLLSLEVSAVAVADVSSVPSLAATLLAVVESGWVIEIEVMLTMAFSFEVTGLRPSSTSPAPT